MKIQYKVIYLLFAFFFVMPEGNAVNTVIDPPRKIEKRKKAIEKIKTLFKGFKKEPEKKFEKMALISLFVGIFGALLFPLSVLSLLFGIIALRKIRDSNGIKKGKGMAYISIVLGGLTFLGLMVVVGAFLVMLSNR